MSQPINIAVLGATGIVGETILEILGASDLAIDKLYPLASSSSVGDTVLFNNRSIAVLDAAEFDFNKTQIAFFTAGKEASAKYAPIAAKAGCIVIDNTSQFRYDDDVPLVIAEVNPQNLAGVHARNIVANPNCSTIQLLVALKPIHDAVGIQRINLATYQSVSGAGRAAIDELAKQNTELLSGKPPTVKIFAKQIAFNLLPQIDSFEDNGYTREEMKIVWETRKILSQPDLKINVTAVRVPTFFGHGEAVHIETRAKITAVDARELLQRAPGIKVIDNCELGEYPTPLLDATGNDQVFVGRIREDISHPTGLDMWVVADNIRKGAALNSVQLAQLLVTDYL